MKERFNLKPGMDTMDIPEISTIDSLLEYLGDCGLFQILAVIALHGSIMVSPWTNVFMAYGNYNPGWRCADPDFNVSSVLNGSENALGGHPTNDTKEDNTCAKYELCKTVVFDNVTSTIVTEWNLACDKSWIMSLMISLQMAGVLIGALSAGQLNIHVGRKATLYGTLFVNGILNLIASFSVSWPMFTVMRFLLGVTSGSIMLCAFVYPMEFVVNRWRGVVAAIPFSSTGSLTFTLSAMIFRDWRVLQRGAAILTAIFFLPVLWAPDSIRWLALKNKIQKAEDVGMKIAKVNRKPPANMEVINQIAETERKVEESKPHFTIIDLYRHGLLGRTFIVTLAWVTNTIIYYCFIFDVKSLSGDFFVNLMLFSLISLLSLPFVPLLTNTIGRKWGIIILMGLASVGCMALVLMNFVETGIDKGLAKLIVVLLIMIFIDAEWAILQLYCVELYPTVLRSLSYSHGSCVARVGGMIAPFLIPRHEGVAYISQLIMLVLVATTCICLFFLPETKDQHLEESVELKGHFRKGLKSESKEAKGQSDSSLA